MAVLAFDYHLAILIGKSHSLIGECHISCAFLKLATVGLADDTEAILLANVLMGKCLIGVLVN